MTTTNTTTMPAEYLHSSRCLAHALICAVENLRDSQGASAHDFRMSVQDNLPLAWADEYLADGTADCLCHSWDVAPGGGCWHGVCACGWKGDHHLDALTAAREVREHAEQAVADAWALVTA